MGPNKPQALTFRDFSSSQNEICQYFKDVKNEDEFVEVFNKRVKPFINQSGVFVPETKSQTTSDIVNCLRL